MSQFTSNTKAFIHAQQYGLVQGNKKVKTINPFKQFQVKSKEKK